MGLFLLLLFYPCAVSSALGIVDPEMTTGYRIDAQRLFSLHPYAKEILERLTAAGHGAVLIGSVEKVRAFQKTYLEGQRGTV